MSTARRPAFDVRPVRSAALWRLVGVAIGSVSGYAPTARRSGCSAAWRWKCQAGSVTMELAAAIPVVVFLLTAGLAAVTATTTQLRCVDAAREAARVAARGDPSAVAVGRRVAPAGARVALVREADLVRVTVSAPLPAVGWIWSGRIEATAVAEPEPAAGAGPVAEPGPAAGVESEPTGRVSRAEPPR